MITLRELRIDAIRRLEQVGNDTARLDVDLLLEQALGLVKLDIILEPERKFDGGQVALFEALLVRRMNREPISQILGRKDFWSLTFKVNRHCLTPRPDSETLIEAALKTIPDKQAPLKILDLGTGSGCLLLSLMSELPHSTGLGIDISDKALACAKENARHLGFHKRCDFIVSDWAKDWAKDWVWDRKGNGAGYRQEQPGKFDIILCNPPYIAPEELIDLAPDVRDYEPHMALFAADEGYEDYRILSGIIPKFITKGGGVFLEIGHTQASRVEGIFQKSGAKNICIIKDLAGRDRCVAFNH